MLIGAIIIGFSVSWITIDNPSPENEPKTEQAIEQFGGIHFPAYQPAGVFTGR